jgi:hypothetical protein
MDVLRTGSAKADLLNLELARPGAGSGQGRSHRAKAVERRRASCLSVAGVSESAVSSMMEECIELCAAGLCKIDHSQNCAAGVNRTANDRLIQANWNIAGARALVYRKAGSS